MPAGTDIIKTCLKVQELQLLADISAGPNIIWNIPASPGVTTTTYIKNILQVQT
jgi:hypothetical protein